MLGPMTYGIQAALQGGGAPSTLLDNLSSYWMFDGDATDAHASNDLTGTNTPTFVAGLFGRQCTNVDDSPNQYWSVADQPELSCGDRDFSVAFRVNFNVLGVKAVVGKSTGGAVATSEFMIYLNSTMRAFVSDGATTTTLAATTAGNLVAGVWYDVIFRHDSVNNKIYLRINDAEDEANWANGVQDTDQPFTVGAIAGGTLTVDAKIQDVGFWPKMLTADEIAEYREGKAYPF